MDSSDSLKAATNLVYPGIPTLLCTWHVNKAVLAKYKGRFATNEEWQEFYATWQTLIRSPTFEKFEERWLQLTTTYDQGATKSCVEYLKNEWIYEGQIERLVTAWTNEYEHFDTTITTRYVKEILFRTFSD